MALARSASGPGGLSINTNSANSLFGSSTTPAPGGMFGNTQANKLPGLFGTSTTTATTQPQSGGGLFGSSTTTSQAQQTGGLFGSVQPQQSGGLFGSSTTNSQPQQAGGMFSALGAQPAQTQPTGGGLFGSNNPAQPTQSGGLFGGLNSQNQPKPAQSLFSGLGGAQNQQSQSQQSSTFPTLNQNQGQGLFGSTMGGGLSLGQSTNQQQTVPGVRIDVTNIRGTTRFNDLHEDLQKQISFLDDFIQTQIQLKNDCDAIMPSHDSQLAQVPNDVEFCRRKLIGVENASDSDVQAISLAQRLVKTDAEHAKLSFKAIDNLKLPPQYHNPNIWSAKASSGDNRAQSNGESETQDIVGFFSTTADELATTLSNYQKHITEIEQHLRGVEANSAQQINILVARRNGSLGGQDDPMDQLTGALRDFEESILGVAGKVGGAREGVQSLQLGMFTARPVNSSKGHRSSVY